jgi:hypothetical protein
MAIEWESLTEDNRPPLGVKVLVWQDGSINEASREMTAPRSPMNPFNPKEYWQTGDEYGPTLNTESFPITYWAYINAPNGTG